MKLLAKATDPLRYIFWKTQVGILHACPPLLGLFNEYGQGSATSPGVWLRSFLKFSVRVPRAVCLHVRNIQEKRIELPLIGVGTTTRCTLCCDKCIGHIPDLSCQRDTPADVLIDDLRRLFDCVHNVYSMYLTGGEPLLNPELGEIVRFCGSLEKLGEINVFTNGTVFPDADLLAALREAKAVVRISRYPSALQPEVETLKALLDAHGVAYIHAGGQYWRDTGALGQPAAGAVKRRFNTCLQRLCLPFLNGKLFVCSEAAMLETEGLLAGGGEDYIDLRVTGPEAFAGQWRALQKKRLSSGCAYCMGNTYNSPGVPVAVQREGG